VVDSVAVPEVCATVYTSKNDSIWPGVSGLTHRGFSAPDRKLITIDDISRLAVSGQSDVLSVVVRSRVLLSIGASNVIWRGHPQNSRTNSEGLVYISDRIRHFVRIVQCRAGHCNNVCPCEERALDSRANRQRVCSRKSGDGSNESSNELHDCNEWFVCAGLLS
jgi:hypothetical protein